jgi:hypothetical protein
VDAPGYVCIVDVMRAHLRGEQVPRECIRKGPCRCVHCRAVETLKRKEEEKARAGKTSAE